jgi:hypothetical protein
MSACPSGVMMNARPASSVSSREHDEPVLIDEMRQATLALTHAIAATSEDRMLVPEALSQSIRHLFVFYLVARSCERQCDHE